MIAMNGAMTMKRSAVQKSLNRPDFHTNVEDNDRAQRDRLPALRAAPLHSRDPGAGNASPAPSKLAGASAVSRTLSV
jgi:hypothetical protein